MDMIKKNLIKPIKLKGSVDIQIIDRNTNEIVDEYYLENTETIQAQIFTGYFYGNATLKLITEDINQFLPGNNVAYVKKIFNLDDIQYVDTTSFSKTQISSTEYEFSFTYNPSLGEKTIYALSLATQDLYNANLSPFTILLLPTPLTVNQNFAIIGKYRVHLDRVPSTFSIGLSTAHYENQNTIVSDIEIDPEYQMWYLQERTFIHPANSTAWFGLETSTIQSSGKVMINYNPDFLNWIDNVYGSNDESVLEKRRKVFSSLWKTASVYYDRVWGRHIYEYQLFREQRLIFDNTADGNSLQYHYQILPKNVRRAIQNAYRATFLYNFITDVLDKYLYGVNRSTLLVKDFSVFTGSGNERLYLEFYQVVKYCMNKNTAFINEYKIPFTIYKECIWAKYWPNDYYGDKVNDKKFILIRKIDANTSYIYKPDGTYDTLDSTYQTATPSIQTYQLTFNELQNILNTEGTNNDYFTGIIINQDDWIHINAVDEFKGVNAVKLTGGDYYLSDGTYQTLAANTNGYLWKPLTGEIVNLDDNTTITNVVIRDTIKIFSKDMENFDTYLVDLPSYNKNNLSYGVYFHNNFGRYCGYNRELLFHKTGIDFDTGNVPKYIQERIIQPTFIDNVSPSFAQNEFATFVLGNAITIDLLQTIDINKYTNHPFNEFKLSNADERYVKFYTYTHPTSGATGFGGLIKFEPRLDVNLKLNISNITALDNLSWNKNDDRVSYCYTYFSNACIPDMIIPIYIEKRYEIPRYSWYKFNCLIELDYSQLDFELDTYIIENNVIMFYEDNNENLIYRLFRVIEWNKKEKKLIFWFHNAPINLTKLYFGIFENASKIVKESNAILLKDSNNFTPSDNSYRGRNTIRAVAGDVIYLK